MPIAFPTPPPSSRSLPSYFLSAFSGYDRDGAGRGTSGGDRRSAGRAGGGGGDYSSGNDGGRRRRGGDDDDDGARVANADGRGMDDNDDDDDDVDDDDNDGEDDYDYDNGGDDDDGGGGGPRADAGGRGVAGPAFPAPAAAAAASARGPPSLSTMFAPPLHLVHRAGGFHGARNFAKDARRWLLANVQSEDDFACHALNRDVWGDELVENLVREGFVLWQAVSVVSFVCLRACVRVFVCCCCCRDPPEKCPRILILPRPSPAHGAHPFVLAAAFSHIPSAAPRLRAWPRR